MKKQDIFNTSLSLIVSQGLHATPMSQIAKEANVAAGTIYHYFSSKEEMIHQLYHTIHGELEKELAVEKYDLLNYEAEFTSLCLRMFRYFIQNPLKFHFLQQYEHSPIGIDSDELDYHIEFPVPEGFFDFGLKNDLVKPLPLSLLTNLVYNNITALIRLQLSEKISLNKEIIQTVIDGCWRMIRR